MSIRIGIAGMAGRMGQLLIEEVAAAGAVCVGGTLRAGGKPAPAGLQSFPDITALFAASDVVIDFTHAETATAHAAAAATCGKGFILGSSGLSTAAEAAVAEAGKRAPIVYAANFAPGVNLFLAIAERMAAALPGAQYDAEIVEMHHRQKVDAPSGTAVALGRAVAPFALGLMWTPEVGYTHGLRWLLLAGVLGVACLWLAQISAHQSAHKLGANNR